MKINMTSQVRVNKSHNDNDNIGLTFNGPRYREGFYDKFKYREDNKSSLSILEIFIHGDLNTKFSPKGLRDDYELTLRRLKTIFPHVCDGDYDFATLGYSFQNFLYKLYDNHWFAFARTKPVFCFYNVVETCIRGKGVMSSYSKATHDNVRRKTNNQALIVFTRNFKFLSKVFYPNYCQFSTWVSVRDAIDVVRDKIARRSGNRVEYQMKALLAEPTKAMTEDLKAAANDVVDSSLEKIVNRLEDRIEGIAYKAGSGAGKGMLSGFLQNLKERWNEFKVSVMTFFQVDSLSGLFFKTVVRMLVVGLFFYGLRECWRWMSNIGVTVATVLKKVMDFDEVPTQVEIHMSGNYTEKQGNTWESFIAYFQSAANVLGANFGLRLRTVNGIFQLCNNVSKTEWIKEAFKSCARVVASWFGYDDVFNDGVQNNLDNMDKELNELLGGRDSLFTPVEFNKRIINLYYSAKKFQTTFLSTLYGPTRARAMKIIEKTTNVYEEVLNNELLTKERVMPAWWYMMGLPKQGKTKLWRMLSPYIYAMLRKRDPLKFPKRKDFVYSKAQGTEFWDQYGAQEFIFGDEILSSLDPVLLGDEARDWLGIVNSAPKPLNMAHVDRKGKCMCTSSLVCTTTNYSRIRNINLTSPAALVRRMSFPLQIEKNKDVRMDLSDENFNEGWNILVCGEVDGIPTDPSPYLLKRMNQETRLITPFELVRATVEHIINEYAQLTQTEDKGVNKDIIKMFMSGLYDSMPSDSSTSFSISSEEDELYDGKDIYHESESLNLVEHQMFAGVFSSFYGSAAAGNSEAESEKSEDTEEDNSETHGRSYQVADAIYYERHARRVDALVDTLRKVTKVSKPLHNDTASVFIRHYKSLGEWHEEEEVTILDIHRELVDLKGVDLSRFDGSAINAIFITRDPREVFTHVLYKSPNMAYIHDIPVLGLSKNMECLVKAGMCTLEKATELIQLVMYTMGSINVRGKDPEPVVKVTSKKRTVDHENATLLELNPDGLASYSGLRRSVVKCASWTKLQKMKFKKGYYKFMSYVKKMFNKMKQTNKVYYDYIVSYLEKHGMLPSQVIASFSYWIKIKCLDSVLGEVFLSIFYGEEGDWRKCCGIFWSDFKKFVIGKYNTGKEVVKAVCADLLLVTKVLVTTLLLGPTLITLIKALKHAIRCVIYWITPERFVNQSLYRGNKHAINHKVPKPVSSTPVVERQQTSVNMFNGQAKVLSNVKKIQFQFSDGSLAGAYVLFVKGRSFITSAHVCPKGKRITHCTINGRGCKGDEAVHINPDMLDRKYYGKRDLVCITSRDPTVPLSKDLISKFPDDMCQRIEGISRLRPVVGAKTSASCISNYKEAGFIPLYTGVDLEGHMTNDYNIYYVPGGMGEAGFCGLPYTSGYSAVVINGIHTARSGSDSIFTGVIKEDFDHLSDEWTEGFQKDCLLKQADFCSVAPLGAFGSAVLPKTVADNPHNDLVPTRFNGGTCVTTKGATRLPPFAVIDKVPVHVKDYEDEDGNRVSLHANACKFHRTENPAMPDKFRVVLESVPSRLWEGMTGMEGSIEDGEFVAWIPSTRETVLGIPGKFDGLDDSTSPGYLLWCLGYKRRDLWNCTEKYVSSKLEKMVEEIEDMAANKICVRSKVIDNKKTELRPLARLDVPRLFCATSAEMCVFVKKHMQAAVSYLKKKGYMGASAVGVNPYSTDWTLIYNYLASLHPDCKWMCGDFSAFDMSVPGYMAHVMFLFTNSLYRYDAGTKKYNCLYVACLSVTQVYHVFRNVVYEVSRGNSSGNWLTGYFNGIVNYVCHKWIFDIKVVPLFPKYKFHDYVRIKTFGDDALLTVHPAVTHLYNMEVVSKAMLSEFGMIYTKSDKSDISEGFVDFEDANFLCRYFCEFEGSMLSKLEYTSIVSPLLYYRRGSVPEKQHLADNIKRAYYEMFTHGPDEYNKFRNRLQYYCRLYGVRVEHPTYSHTRDMYMSQYRDQCFPTLKDNLQLY